MDVIKRGNTLKINLSLLYIRNSLGFLYLRFFSVFLLERLLKMKRYNLQRANQLIIVNFSCRDNFYVKEISVIGTMQHYAVKQTFGQ